MWKGSASRLTAHEASARKGILRGRRAGIAGDRSRFGLTEGT